MRYVQSEYPLTYIKTIKMSLICSASSVDEEGSPKEGNGNGYGNEDDDNSILWSVATGGGNIIYNGYFPYFPLKYVSENHRSRHTFSYSVKTFCNIFRIIIFEWFKAIRYCTKQHWKKTNPNILPQYTNWISKERKHQWNIIKRCCSPLSTQT